MDHLLRVKIDKVPDHIPLIAGDAFYCLRSALDQTVWALAKSSSLANSILHVKHKVHFKRSSRGRSVKNYCTTIVSIAIIMFVGRSGHGGEHHIVAIGGCKSEYAK